MQDYKNPTQLVWFDSGDQWIYKPAIKGENNTYVDMEAYELYGKNAEIYWIYDNKNLTYGAGIEGIQKPLDPLYNTIKPIE